MKMHGYTHVLIFIKANSGAFLLCHDLTKRYMEIYICNKTYILSDIKKFCSLCVQPLLRCQKFGQRNFM